MPPALSAEELLERFLRRELGFGRRAASDRVRELVCALAAREGCSELEIVDRALTRRDDRLRRRLLEAATVRHTLFFRHAEQFDELRRRLGTQARGRALRIWCAGCATGEEPVSIALCAADVGAKVQILATDVSAEAIDFARRGAYPARRTRGLGREGPFSVPRDVMRSIRYEVASLVGPRPAADLGPFDVVFCRNVLLYFDREDATRLLAKLAGHLVASGALAVSPAETVIPIPDELAWSGPVGWLVRSGARKKAAPARPEPSPTVASQGAADGLADAARRLGAGDARGAEHLLARWLDAHPDDARAWFLLGNALAQRGERLQARIAFERCEKTAGREDAPIAAAARRSKTLA